MNVSKLCVTNVPERNATDRDATERHDSASSSDWIIFFLLLNKREREDTYLAWGIACWLPPPSPSRGASRWQRRRRGSTRSTRIRHRSRQSCRTLIEKGFYCYCGWPCYYYYYTSRNRSAKHPSGPVKFDAKRRKKKKRAKWDYSFACTAASIKSERHGCKKRRRRGAGSMGSSSKFFTFGRRNSRSPTSFSFS